MKIAAYQFKVNGNIEENSSVIENAIISASKKDADLIIFPECALTGYPPKDIEESKSVYIPTLTNTIERVQRLADENHISIILGSIAYDVKYYNRAYLFTPGEKAQWYDKRALYGWDQDNFTEGSQIGIFDVNGFKIGVRICFEVRFPEYFRELYRANSDLNVVLFNDTSETEDNERYQMIKSHLITRAVENVTPVLSVNTFSVHQTAPTCFIDASGKVLDECEKETEGMIIIDFQNNELNFGEIGRISISDKLLGRKPNK